MGELGILDSLPRISTITAAAAAATIKCVGHSLEAATSLSLDAFLVNQPSYQMEAP